MEIIKLSEYTGNAQKDAAKIFVDGYYEDLSMLCKNKNRLVAALEGAFNESVFYIAILEGNLVGITACADAKGRALQLDKKQLKKHVGFIKGTFAYKAMAKEFHTPLVYPDNKAYIECVATRPAARGKGVATALMKHILHQTPYTEYELEVTDANVTAKKLYEKLGFQVCKVVKERVPKVSEFNERIYMRLQTT